MLSAAVPVLFFTLLYAAIIMRYSVGLKRLEAPSPARPAKPIPVTLLIPFRNESAHLEALVADLSAQAYPPEKLEVLFIDDHSDDGSGELLRDLLEEMPRFGCLELPEGASGKKQAIQHGIRHASASWIIQTDADCRLGPLFVSSHVAFLEQHPSDLVGGLVTTLEGRGTFLEMFERLDILGLAGTGAGSFYYRRPVMCSGANLGYSRELYLETRRFDPSDSLASGDDMFLMIGARKLKKRLSFNIAREAMVKTVPAPGVRSLVLQRVRWGSKTGRYGMTDIQLLALVVAVTNLLVLSIPLWLVLFPSGWTLLLAALLIKTLADVFMLHAVTGLAGQRKALRFFLPAALFYYFYQLAVLAGVLFAGRGWKGRKN